MPPNCEVTSVPSLLAIQLPRATKQGRSGWISSASMPPGRTPAMSPHPPSAGAVYVVEKKDSPQSTERLSPFMMPPLAALLEICTPGECAIMAPLSTCTLSPASSRRRETAKDGL